MTAPQVESTDDPTRALTVADEFLTSRPVEHNVVLTAVHQLIASGEPGRCWTVRSGGAVEGFAVHAPGSQAQLTPMPAAAAQQLAARMADERGDTVAGAFGEAGTAAAFAGAWSELLTGHVTVEEGQRLYRLDGLTAASPVSGRLRRADQRDGELLTEWWQAFAADTGLSMTAPHQAVQREIAARRLFVWDDAGPVCMARATPAAARASRIGFVYTPDAHRRSGYALACTAALSAHVQHVEGCDCVLYTQLANRSSNALYRRLGYRAVSEALSYRFRARG